MGCARLSGARGFTLIEVMVALTIMAVLAALSWQVIDSMVRAQQNTRSHTDDVLALQAALTQWRTDLDAQVGLPDMGAMLPDQSLQREPVPIDWDGRSLRLTRHASLGDGAGVQVVAWARRGDGWWVRWASPPLQTVGQWRQSWQQAQQWGQSAGADARSVALLPIGEWAVYYYRNDAWTNAQSSAGTGVDSGGQTALAARPDGVRLNLTPAAGQAIAGGPLTVDWVRPTRGGGR